MLAPTANGSFALARYLVLRARTPPRLPHARVVDHFESELTDHQEIGHRSEELGHSSPFIGCRANAWSTSRQSREALRAPRALKTRGRSRYLAWAWRGDLPGAGRRDDFRLLFASSRKYSSTAIPCAAASLRRVSIWGTVPPSSSRRSWRSVSPGTSDCFRPRSSRR